MSSMPPVIPVNNPPPPPLEENLQTPVTTTFGAVEALLREPYRIVHQLTQSNRNRIIGLNMVIGLVCSLFFGVVVGSFSGGNQIWIAALKVSIGLFTSALICLPSLYIFACLSGCKAKPVEIAGLLAGLVALAGILLVGFAPVAWVFSQSTKSIGWMGFFYLTFWLVSAGFGLRFLWSGFKRFKSGASGGLVVWICIFFLVSLQMTTALRPLLGTSTTVLPVEKQFFLQHWVECTTGPAASGESIENPR